LAILLAGISTSLAIRFLNWRNIAISLIGGLWSESPVGLKNMEVV
jgi:hypothetical protein